MRLSRYFLSLLFLSLASPVYALITDAPHNEDKLIACADCHSYSLWWRLSPPATQESRDSLVQGVCLTCHNGTGEPPAAQVHSAAALGLSGLWSETCTDCHDPHFQSQLRWQGNGFDDEIFLVTGRVQQRTIELFGNGTVAAPYQTTFTYENIAPGRNPFWAANIERWAAKNGNPDRGLILTLPHLDPEFAGPYMTYEITDVDAFNSKITISGDFGAMRTPFDIAGVNFGLIYGQLIRDAVEGAPGPGMVKFFDPLGGYVDLTSRDGICQACHDATDHFRFDGSGIDPRHSTIVDASSGNCLECHYHDQAFGHDPAKVPACTDCHGNPPILGSAGGPGGLVNIPGGTGSTQAGAHDIHVSGLSLECAACHNNADGKGLGHNSGLFVSIGFGGFTGATSTQGGHYDGQVGVGYEAMATVPTTSVAANPTGQMLCSNTYCHGNFLNSGKNSTPSWTGTPVPCGTCHGASNNEPPAVSAVLNDGAHQRHAGIIQDPLYGTWARQMPCTLCHTGVIGGSGPANYITLDQRHVNGFVEVEFDTSDPRLAGGSYSITSGSESPSDGIFRPYGSCMTYCHSTVQANGGSGPPSVYDTPVWGQVETNCQGCHNQSGAIHGVDIATGSHASHVGTHAFGLTDKSLRCTVCHKWNPVAARGSCGQQCHDADEQAYHVNGSVDVMFDSFVPATAGYSGTPAPGDGYGACDNTYCHSDGSSVSSGAVIANASPTWGVSPLGCDGCHAYPPGYINGTPKANSHNLHLEYGCQACHAETTGDGTSITSGMLHVNQVYDVGPDTAGGVSFEYTYDPDGGSCTNISCHSVFPDAVWGQPR